MVELLLVMAVIAVLAGLLMPGASLVRDGARSAACQGHLRQLGLAAAVYAQEHRGRLLPTTWWLGGSTHTNVWTKELNEYLRDAYARPETSDGRSVFWGCPSWQGRVNETGSIQQSSPGYGMNRKPLRGDDVPVPDQISQCGIVIAWR